MCLWRIDTFFLGQKTPKTFERTTEYETISCQQHSHTPFCYAGKLGGHRCCPSWFPGSVGVFWADWQLEGLLDEYLCGPCSAAPPDPRTHRSTPPPPSALKHKCSPVTPTCLLFIWHPLQLYVSCRIPSDNLNNQCHAHCSRAAQVVVTGNAKVTFVPTVVMQLTWS